MTASRVTVWSIIFGFLLVLELGAFVTAICVAVWLLVRTAGIA